MPASTIQFYNRIAPFYGAIDFFLKPQRKTLIDEVNSQPPGRLLEIGIGTGTYLPLYTGHTITGIDTSAAMLQRAQQHQNERTQLLLMGGDNLQFEMATFDYAVLSHVMAVVAKPEQVLQEVARVLKPKGKVFILNHFTPDNWLQYIDKTFNALSRTFHFHSYFAVENIMAFHQFTLVRQINIGKLSYFKLLILQKP